MGQTVVERVVEFAVSRSEWRFTFDSESDLNSGTNLHTSSDFRGLVFQSKFDKQTKKRHMVIGKLQRFGDASKRIQLDFFVLSSSVFRC